MELSGGRALLEDVCPGRQTVGFYSLGSLAALLLCFLNGDEEVRSRLLPLDAAPSLPVAVPSLL